MMNILIEITIIIILTISFTILKCEVLKTELVLQVNWYYDVNAALEICNECLQWEKETLEFKPNNRPDVCCFFFLSFSFSVILSISLVRSLCHSHIQFWFLVCVYSMVLPYMYLLNAIFYLNVLQSFPRNVINVKWVAAHFMRRTFILYPMFPRLLKMSEM